MEHIDFEGMTTVFTPPINWDKPTIYKPLAVQNTGRQLISCWKPTWKERLRLLFGKPVYLHIVANVQPPVMLETYKYDNILIGES